MEKKKDWYDVDITMDLMEKDKSLLEEHEIQAIEYYKKNLERVAEKQYHYNQDILENCKILCSGYEHSMIPSGGWSEPIRKMCYILEALNLQYKKYGVYVNVGQSKSKMATLCFYYDINYRRTGIIGFISNIFKSISTFISKNVDFCVKTVVDKPYYTSIEWEEISKDQFDNRIANKSIVVDDMSKVNKETLDQNNVYYTDNNIYKKAYVLGHAVISHTEVTKHKMIFKLLTLLRNIDYFMQYTIPQYPSNKLVINRRAFEYVVSTIIKDCEHQCTQYCEKCGDRLTINTKYPEQHSNKCYTHGWHAFLCRKCAVAGYGIYQNLSDDKYYSGINEVENPYEKRKNNESEN